MGAIKASEQKNGVEMMKTIIATQGGKGGVGKTMAALEIASALESIGVKFKALDVDDENIKGGALRDYLPDTGKVNINKRGGLDSLAEVAEKASEPVILADFGARSGAATFDFFNDLHDALKGMMRFVSVAVVTQDPASLASVLKWASELRDRAQYLVILNAMDEENPDWKSIKENSDFKTFVELAKPVIIEMPSLLPEPMKALRSQCILPAKVAQGKVSLGSITQNARVKSWHQKFQDVLKPALLAVLK